MTRFFKRFMLALSLTAPQALAVDQTPLSADLYRDVLPLVARLQLEPSLGTQRSKLYYGTAVMMEHVGDEVFYMTNAHLINDDEIKDLRLVLSSCGDRRVPINSTTYKSPGFDVAVVSVRWPSDCAPITGSIEDHIKELTPDTMRQVSHAGVLGFPRWGSTSKPELVAEFWYDYMMRRFLLMGREHIPGMNTPHATNYVGQDKRIDFSQQCPVPFLQTCFRAPLFLDFGFSGAPLLINSVEPSESSFKIAGMLSHYSPLSSDVFIIPIRTVIEEARRLRAAGVAVLRVDPTETFELTGDRGLTVLKGPLTGVIVTDSSGPGNGAGFETRGGGFETRGGGGTCLQSSIIYHDQETVEMRAPWAAFLADARAPQRWSETTNLFRQLMTCHRQFYGVDSLFDLRFGVTANDKATYQHRDGKIILNRADFMRAYSTGDYIEATHNAVDVKPLTLEEALPVRTRPSPYFIAGGNTGPGYYATLVAVPSYGGSIKTVLEGKKRDAAIHGHMKLSPDDSRTVFKFTEFTSSKYSEPYHNSYQLGRFQMLDRQLYKYEGPCTRMTTLDRTPGETRSCYALVMVQIGVSNQGVEVKGMVSYVDQGGRVIVEGFFLNGVSHSR